MSPSLKVVIPFRASRGIMAIQLFDIHNIFSTGTTAVSGAFTIYTMGDHHRLFLQEWTL